MVIDTLFLIASAAFGWGLSLATYRLFAVRNGWPMGEVQADRPLLAVVAGVFAITAAFLFAAARGTESGGWGILVLGLVLALLWTGILRVGSQVSLFLAPLAAVVLMLGWAHIQFPGSDRELVPNRTYLQRERSGTAPPAAPRASPAVTTGSVPAAYGGGADGMPATTAPWRRDDAASRTMTRLAASPKRGEAVAAPEIRDARDQIEVLPAAPSGLPRPFDPASLEDPALLQPKFAAPKPQSEAPRQPVQPASKIE